MLITADYKYSLYLRSITVLSPFESIVIIIVLSWPSLNFSFTVNSLDIHSCSSHPQRAYFSCAKFIFQILTNLSTISMATPWASCPHSCHQSSLYMIDKIDLLIYEFHRIRKPEEISVRNSWGYRKPKYPPEVCFSQSC